MIARSIREKFVRQLQAHTCPLGQCGELMDRAQNTAMAAESHKR